jgi:hypothetical protein
VSLKLLLAEGLPPPRGHVDHRDRIPLPTLTGSSNLVPGPKSTIPVGKFPTLAPPTTLRFSPFLLTAKFTQVTAPLESLKALGFHPYHVPHHRFPSTFSTLITACGAGRASCLPSLPAPNIDREED